MRLVVFLFLTSVGLALPIVSVPLALRSAAPETGTAADRIRHELLIPKEGIGAASVAEMEDITDALVDAIPLRLPLGKRSDLLLLDGRWIRAAQIVAVDDENAMIDGEEGMVKVPLTLLTAELVEQARRALVAAAEAVRQSELKEQARVVERLKELEAKRAEELRQRMAAVANLPDGAAFDDGTSAPKPRVLDREGRLELLKSKFPRRKRGKSELGMEFDLPPRQLWASYFGPFQAATLATLPETLAALETRLTRDIAAWEWRARSGAALAASLEFTQADRTATWLKGTMRDFLDDAWRLARER